METRAPVPTRCTPGGAPGRPGLCSPPCSQRRTWEAFPPGLTDGSPACTGLCTGRKAISPRAEHPGGFTEAGSGSGCGRWGGVRSLGRFLHPMVCSQPCTFSAQFCRMPGSSRAQVWAYSRKPVLYFALSTSIYWAACAPDVDVGGQHRVPESTGGPAGGTSGGRSLQGLEPTAPCRSCL